SGVRMLPWSLTTVAPSAPASQNRWSHQRWPRGRRTARKASRFGSSPGRTPSKFVVRIARNGIPWRSRRGRRITSLSGGRPVAPAWPRRSVRLPGGPSGSGRPPPGRGWSPTRRSAAPLCRVIFGFLRQLDEEKAPLRQHRRGEARSDEGNAVPGDYVVDEAVGDLDVGHRRIISGNRREPALGRLPFPPFLLGNVPLSSLRSSRDGPGRTTGTAPVPAAAR